MWPNEGHPKQMIRKAVRVCESIGESKERSARPWNEAGGRGVGPAIAIHRKASVGGVGAGRLRRRMMEEDPDLSFC
jgi:hypothetical protein